MDFTNFPKTAIEFENRFPDDEACWIFLWQAKWPMGFRCSSCPGRKAYHIIERNFEECVKCGAQTSVTPHREHRGPGGDRRRTRHLRRPLRDIQWRRKLGLPRPLTTESGPKPQRHAPAGRLNQRFRPAAGLFAARDRPVRRAAGGSIAQNRINSLPYTANGQLSRFATELGVWSPNPTRCAPPPLIDAQTLSRIRSVWIHSAHAAAQSNRDLPAHFG